MSKSMKLLDCQTGLMECKFCGAKHFANIRPESGGRYYRGSWQCKNGCGNELIGVDVGERPSVSSFVEKNSIDYD